MPILWDDRPSALSQGFPTWRVALDGLEALGDRADEDDAKEHWQKIVEIVWLAFKHLPGAQAGDLQDEVLNQFRSRRHWDFPTNDEIAGAIEAAAAKHGVAID